MKKIIGLSFLLAALTAVSLAPSPALAGCGDPPGPGVDWRNCNMSRQEMPGANLTKATLWQTNLNRSDIAGADLSEADANRALFLETRMPGASLDGGRFTYADFSRADLTGASLKGANLSRARFHNAILREADFTGADIRDADFFRADLRGALWIDGKRRCGEDSIGACR
ncbi:pentapeptide repeat-containing protein [Oceanibaculum indicum]|uniref:Pentapeptide repeat-containing protein n=1 Tax=Oceanibaculum indicum P24 TaxID=1207063 RepID=K2J8I9_9PROT|nr:pentapeptide repeat-containing protein [Oceanibaculum indicum]EKE71538.1 pentapeptide repeat-containing protein [Oceanibaculum indicum P24]